MDKLIAKNTAAWTTSVTEFLLALRTGRGLSLRAASKAIGFSSPTSLQMLEGGKRKALPLPVFLRLCRLYDAHPSDVLRLENPVGAWPDDLDIDAFIEESRETIRDARPKTVTYGDICGKCNLHLGWLQSVESGRYRADLRRLHMISQLYEKPVESIVGLPVM